MVIPVTAIIGPISPIMPSWRKKMGDLAFVLDARETLCLGAIGPGQR